MPTRERGLFDEPECYLVLAHNFFQARNWAVKQGLPTLPGRQSGWLYAFTPERIEGIRDVQVVILEGFWKRSNAYCMFGQVDLLYKAGLAEVVGVIHQL